MRARQSRREFVINSARLLSGGAVVSMLPGGLVNSRLADGPLSPAHWDEEERQVYWRLTTSAQQPKPVARGSKAVVIGTTGAFAVRAGMEAIHQGGNAMDAALTTALTQVALTAGGPTSYAGIMNCVYFDSGTGRVYALDGGYNVPTEETDPLSIPNWGTSSGRAVLTPGFMPGIEAAHQRFGTLPFANLFDPAVYVAENGFEVSSAFDQLMLSRRDFLSRRKTTRDVFCKSDGSFYGLGDQFRQPSLARTLKNVAKYGAEYMTGGNWARRFCRVVSDAGGNVSLRDLKQYAPLWSEPHSTTYNDDVVYASYAGRPGGVSLVESVNLMELAGLGEIPHYTRSSDAFYWLTQIALMSMVMNDPNPERLQRHLPSISTNAEDRVTKKHAEAIWHKLRKPGWLRQLLPNILTAGSHSDGIIAIDGRGNTAVLAHSINSAPWGHLGLFVDGVSIPGSGAFLQKEMYLAGPGNRIWAGLNPHLVLRQGKPVLAGNSIGSGMHGATLQRLSSVLDGKMELQAAIEAPVFHGPYFEDEYIKIGVEKGAFSEKLLKSVEKKGQYVLVMENEESWMHRGYWIGLSIDPQTRERKGCTCKELNGYAIAN